MVEADLNLESLKYILWIAGVVITLLLAVIGYFLRMQAEASRDLAMSVNQLTVAVNVMQSQNSDRHPVTERRLNDHAKRLDEHDRRLTIVETTCQKNHCHDEIKQRRD